MKRREAISTIIPVAVGGIIAVNAMKAVAKQTGKPVWGRTDPSKFNDAPNAHKGAGTLKHMELIGHKTFDTNLLFVHRGIIPPKSGIGEHIHRKMAEMYIIFNGSARFTVNGRTAHLPAGAMVQCPMGSSHGIYNHTDEEVQWMNVAVSLEKGKGDSIDYNDDTAKNRVESPAPFPVGYLNRRLLIHLKSTAHGGKGFIDFRRVFSEESFKVNWGFMDHCYLPPKTSIGYHRHDSIEEIYYLMSGRGKITVNDVTWDVRGGDAIPCTLHDSHGIYNNTDEYLELLNICTLVKKGDYSGKDHGDDLKNR